MLGFYVDHGPSFLEVNLHFKGDVNLVTMADKTLGVLGKVISWSAYLLLLYCLTAAYIAGSTPIFTSFVQEITGYQIPRVLAPFPMLIFFGIFVYLGTRSVDLINRFFMIGLILAYILLVIFLPSHVQLSYLSHMDLRALALGLPVVITSFGFHVIIPSLTTYMNHNRKKLTLTIIIGSTLPLIVYVLWEFLILGTVPLTGENSLVSAWQEGASATVPLMRILKNPLIGLGAHLFAFCAIITSFLGVSLSLSDFLTDGLKIKKTGGGRLIACLLTFIPPLIFVLVYQHGFILALQYAAIFVAILLGILPALMAWTLPKKFKGFWKRCLLIAVILASIAVIVIDLLDENKDLSKLIEKYVNNAS